MADADFKGTGWAFPPAFGRGGASVATVSGDEDILECLQILLATAPGERIMRPSFGCDLKSFVFEEVDQTLVHRITRIVSDAILYNEPRVVLEDVDVSPSGDDGAVLDIRITYRSRLTNTRYNMVWPFYLDEAARTPVSEER